jgi:cytochrome c553
LWSGSSGLTGGGAHKITTVTRKDPTGTGEILGTVLTRSIRFLVAGLVVGYGASDYPVQAAETVQSMHPGGAAEVSQWSATPPAWAFPLNADGPAKSNSDDGQLLHVPNSTVGLSATAMRDRFVAVDWHPDRHPQMPEGVGVGRKPDLNACAFCHYPNGEGRSENSSLAGLSAQYIIAQVAAIRDGTRKSSQGAMLASNLMKAVADHASAQDVERAASYFAALTYQPWIRVVETDTVPKVRVKGVSAWGIDPAGGTEPIGDRIVEVPENEELTALRDDASGFVAYVRSGSLKRGEVIALRNSEEHQACVNCHGSDLKGSNIAPPLAGRSPSYMFRQLYDIHQGNRRDANAEPMIAELAALSEANARDVVAYLASLNP